MRLGHGTGDSLLNGSLKDQQINQLRINHLIDHIYTSAGGFGNIKGGPDLGRVAISKDSSLLTNLMINSSHLSQ